MEKKPLSMNEQLDRLAKAHQVYLQQSKGNYTMSAKTKTTRRILPDLAAEKRIKELEAQVASLEKTSKSALKVSSKGGVSLYGLGRFPVTLYKSQWETLFKAVPEIQSFIKKNESKLAVKE